MNYEKPTTAMSGQGVTGDEYLDSILQNRQNHLASQAKDIGKTLDAVGSLNALVNAFEAATGATPSGEQLSGTQRAISAVSAAATPLGVLGKASNVVKEAGVASEVLGAAKGVGTYNKTVAAAAGVVMRSADDVLKTNEHHAIPMFLGGADSKLNIIRIPEEIHKKFHAALEQSLKDRFGLPARGTAGSKIAWAEHFAFNPGDQQKAMAIVLDVSLKQGYDIFNQALKTLKTPGMVNWIKPN